MKVSALRIFVVIALFFCAGNVYPQNTIAPDELNAMIQQGTAPVILDVRTEGEYHNGHIPGALNIPHTQLSARLDELNIDKDSEVIVHCQAGPRAGVASGILSEAGYTRVIELQGHMSRWASEGFPVE